ncbi:MAG: putative DNA binding domain-containing protein, partial [Candidatus Dadabacteria bacterium]|nr:putative DNA binding domain-containing protein [Candidatus Dadabacteria bacterium]
MSENSVSINRFAQKEKYRECFEGSIRILKYEQMDRVKNDLVEFPRETLENEYKGWVDLNQDVTPAKIARHLAALANHGGGHLVFGFQDDMTPDPKRPTSLDKYNRDTFTGIVKKYLDPHFQCEVDLVADRTGDKFPVARVPGHGRTPVITT